MSFLYKLTFKVLLDYYNVKILYDDGERLLLSKTVIVLIAGGQRPTLQGANVAGALGGRRIARKPLRCREESWPLRMSGAAKIAPYIRKMRRHLGVTGEETLRDSIRSSMSSS